ncbi:MAG: DUF692 family multinuclear iron-containing protein, partial [Actinomycetes bacterium]
ADYPLSLHGVGLGLGSARGFSVEHLDRVRSVVLSVQPALVSEHLSWGAVSDRQLNDLLPLVLDDSSLSLMCERVDRVQEALDHQLLIENLSTHVRFHQDSMSEAQFLAVLASRTGCGLLLDVNNLYVNQCNHGEDALTAMQQLPVGTVGEIHLGGHLVTPEAVIDTHGDLVADPVWLLYEAAIERFGHQPTLIEWDTDIPALGVLLGEAERARVLAGSVTTSIEVDFDVDVADKGELSNSDLDPVRAPATAHARLAATQEDFATALMDDSQADRALRHFAGEHGRHRLALYRGNQFTAWERVLRAAYPVMEMLVGEEFFEGLSREFGIAVPSSSPDLNEFGAGFADFLETFPHVADYPYFPDMARLEWAIHRTHYAHSAPPVVSSTVLELPPELMMNARVQMDPACGLFASEWSVVQIWRAHQEDDDACLPESVSEASHALILRPQWKVMVLPLNPAEHVYLTHLADGAGLGSARANALEIEPGFDADAQLLRWLDAGLFTQVDLE